MQKTIKILTIVTILIFAIFSSQKSFSFILNSFFYDNGNDPNFYGGGNIAPEELKTLPLGYPDYLDNCWVHRSTDHGQNLANTACIAAAFGIPALLAACDANKIYDWPDFPKICQERKAAAYKDIMKERTAFKACTASNAEEFLTAIEQPFVKSGKKEIHKPLESKTLKYNIAWPLDWTCATGFELRRPARFKNGFTNGILDTNKTTNEMICDGRCGILEYDDGRYWEVIKVKFLNDGKTIRTLMHAEKEEKVDQKHSSDAKCAYYKARQLFGIEDNATSYCDHTDKLNYTWLNEDDPENVNTFHKIRTKEMDGYMVVINKEINLLNNISISKPLNLKPKVFRHIHRTKINGNGHIIKFGENINTEKDEAWIYNEGIHHFWFNDIIFDGPHHILGSKTAPFVITNSTFKTEGTAFTPWKMWILTGNTFENKSETPTIQFGKKDPLFWIKGNQLDIDLDIYKEWLLDNGITQYQKESQKDFDLFITKILNNPLLYTLQCNDIEGLEQYYECRKKAIINDYKEHNLVKTATMVRNFISGPGIVQDYNIIAKNNFINQHNSNLFTFSGYSKGNTLFNNTYQIGNNNNLEDTISFDANLLFGPLKTPKHLKIEGEDGTYHDSLLSHGTPITTTGGLTHNKIRVEVDERTKVIELYSKKSVSYQKILTATNFSNLLGIESDGQFFIVGEPSSGKIVVDVYFSTYYDDILFSGSPIYVRSLTSTIDTQGSVLEHANEKSYHFMSNHETPSKFIRIDFDSSEEAWQAKHHYHDSEQEKEAFSELTDALAKKNLKELVEKHCIQYVAPKKIDDLVNRCKFDCPTGTDSFFCKENCADINDAKEAHTCIIETGCSLLLTMGIPDTCSSYYKKQLDYDIDTSLLLTSQSHWWNHYAEQYNPCIEKYCNEGDKECSGELIAKDEISQPSDIIKKCIQTNACQTWDANERNFKELKTCVKSNGAECLKYNYPTTVKPIFKQPDGSMISVEEKCSLVTDEDKATYSFLTISEEPPTYHSDEDCKWFEEWASAQYKCVNLECYNDGNIESGWKIDNHECIRTSCNNSAYYIEDNECVPCPNGKIAEDDWSGCRPNECDIDSDCSGSNYSCENHKCELKECPEGYIAKSWGCQKIDPDDETNENEESELPLNNDDTIGNEENFIIGGYVSGDDEKKNNSVQVVETNSGSGGCSLINPNGKQKTPALFLIIFFTLVLIYRKRVNT